MFKSGFVSIFGRPNAGKSTLLNALMGEKLAIVSPKVQTTRHRIKAFLSGENYQIILSDTPGIIEPKYKLHERMMQSVKASLEDADLAIFLVDLWDDLESQHQVFDSLKIKAPALVVLNKIDGMSAERLEASKTFFAAKSYCKKMVAVSALKRQNLAELTEAILEFIPEGHPFYEGDDLSDLPTKFFVGEMIREKIYLLYEDEIPYHAAVLINEFKEKTGLIKIGADIIVQRETQKGIILGQGGKKIRQLGTEARKDIETFLGSKIFLELFVKVRPHWRDNDIHLKEYGYHGA